MMAYKQYRRKQIAELADWTPDFDMTSVSISEPDKANGSPKDGDKIARNPKNHADLWLVAAQYFTDNFERTTDNAAGQGATEQQTIPKGPASSELLAPAAPSQTRIAAIARYMKSLENFDDAEFLRRLEALVHQQHEALQHIDKKVPLVGEEWSKVYNAFAAYDALKKEMEK